MTDSSFIDNDNHYQLKYHILFLSVNPYMEICAPVSVQCITFHLHKKSQRRDDARVSSWI